MPPGKWDGRSLHFGAAWHQYTDINTGANGKSTPRDIVYTSLAGEGRYVGDCLTLYNTVNGWWGEGDEKIYVDGEAFPSHFGTGTEDYYGYAWCRPEVFTGHPFIAMPAGDGNLGVGYTVNSRCRMLDAIPFTRSLRFDMELWHWQEARMNYAPATMWYMRPAAYAASLPTRPEYAARRHAAQSADPSRADGRHRRRGPRNPQLHRRRGLRPVPHQRTVEPEHAALLAQCSGGFHTHAGVRIGRGDRSPARRRLLAGQRLRYVPHLPERTGTDAVAEPPCPGTDHQRGCAR